MHHNSLFLSSHFISCLLCYNRVAWVELYKIEEISVFFVENRVLVAVGKDVSHHGEEFVSVLLNGALDERRGQPSSKIDSGNVEDLAACIVNTLDAPARREDETSDVTLFEVFRRVKLARHLRTDPKALLFIEDSLADGSEVAWAHSNDALDAGVNQVDLLVDDLHNRVHIILSIPEGSRIDVAVKGRGESQNKATTGTKSPEIDIHLKS